MRSRTMDGGTFRPIHRGKLSQPFLMGYDTSCDRGGILVQAEYRMWDSFKGYPRRTAQADMKASQFERIRDDGILVVDGFISGEIAEQFALAIERLAELELGKGGARPVSGNGYYVRNLIEKDRVFHPLLRSKAIGIARMLLGPRVSMRVDSRIAFAGIGGAGVPWHIHFPGVSEPSPPWFSPPHSLHCLIYLDDVGPDEGALRVIPCSYTKPFLRPEEIDEGSAVSILPRRGDCVFMHGNTWHRTDASSEHSKQRTLMFLGFTAAWVQGDSNAGGQPRSGVVPYVDPSTSWEGDPEELDELLARFRW